MVIYAIHIFTQQAQNYVRCNHIHGGHKCNKHQGIIFFLNFMPLINLNVDRYNHRMTVINDVNHQRQNVFHSAL